ncbi:MAG: DNA adenine methylase, partial [Prolixibacteraceae bacterium]
MNGKIEISANKNSVKNKTTPAKPFLKWAGGKGQLLESFRMFYPEELKQKQIKYFYEPFVGGGAVFFDVVQKFEVEKAFLYDINAELTLTYKVVQFEVQKLIDYLRQYRDIYSGLDNEKQKQFYYQLRAGFNENLSKIDYTRFSEHWIERAAQVIFLNKTCFNGLFRFNLKGEFNVPAGRYKNPCILDEQNLRKVSEVLSVAEIFTADFKRIEKMVKKDSFVYFDPPYRPLNKTSSFTAYSKNSFTDKEQKELAQLFQRLDKKGTKLMLSNSDPRNSNP